MTDSRILSHARITGVGKQFPGIAAGLIQTWSRVVFELVPTRILIAMGKPILGGKVDLW